MDMFVRFVNVYTNFKTIFLKLKVIRARNRGGDFQQAFGVRSVSYN